MHLSKILQSEADSIISAWQQQMFETYQPETAEFLVKKKDRFQNPVGFAIGRCIKVLFGYLLNNTTDEEASKAMDDIVRVRSIQKFTPDEALGFIFGLKDIIRKSVAGYSLDSDYIDQIKLVDDKIDQMMLTAVNIYVQCRVKLIEIKSYELQRAYHKALERSNLFQALEKEIEDSDEKEE